MYSDREIRDRLKEQLAIEFNCLETDFSKEENVITIHKLNPGRRIYSKKENFLAMVTMGEKNFQMQYVKSTNREDMEYELTYNSNHMEGSRLTHDQTRYIYETNTIGVENEVINVDDVIETANHFRCIDMIIENAN